MTKAKQSQTISVIGCVRCGKTYHVTVKKFGHPVVISENEIYTHFSICPITDEPILHRFERLTVEN